MNGHYLMKIALVVLVAVLLGSGVCFAGSEGERKFTLSTLKYRTQEHCIKTRDALLDINNEQVFLNISCVNSVMYSEVIVIPEKKIFGGYKNKAYSIASQVAGRACFPLESALRLMSTAEVSISVACKYIESLPVRLNDNSPYIYVDIYHLSNTMPGGNGSTTFARRNGPIFIFR